MQWHRLDGWKEGDLPQGYRPVVMGEEVTTGTTESKCGGKWVIQTGNYKIVNAHQTSFIRTTRPLVFTHEGMEWTWHKAGDPMPCDGNPFIQIVRKDGVVLLEQIQAENRTWDTDLTETHQILGWCYADAEKPDEIPWIEWHGGPCPLKDEEVEEWERQYRNGTTGNGVKPSAFDWLNRGWNNDIIAYRVLKWREKKPKVPLGPEDVPPSSVLRHKKWTSGEWMMVSGNGLRTVVAWINGNMVCEGYERLLEEYEINRSLSTGKWNPETWEPCSKPATK